MEDLLDSSVVPRFALVSSSLGDGGRELALLRRLEAACEVEHVSEAELAALAPTESPQGVLVVAATPRWSEDDIRLSPGAVVLVLDAVQDPGNLGTLLRTAEALGARGAVLLSGSVDPWNAKAVRASAGSAFRLPTVALEPSALGAWLRDNGVRLLAADAAGEPVDAVDRGGSVALAVGNEGAGLSPTVLERCDARVAIPLRGRAESLNVAVAAGILLHELLRRREDD